MREGQDTGPGLGSRTLPSILIKHSQRDWCILFPAKRLAFLGLRKRTNLCPVALRCLDIRNQAFSLDNHSTYVLCQGRARQEECNKKGWARPQGAWLPAGEKETISQEQDSHRFPTALCQEGNTLGATLQSSCWCRGTVFRKAGPGKPTEEGLSAESPGPGHRVQNPRDVGHLGALLESSSP